MQRLLNALKLRLKIFGACVGDKHLEDRRFGNASEALATQIKLELRQPHLVQLPDRRSREPEVVARPCERSLRPAADN